MALVGLGECLLVLSSRTASVCHGCSPFCRALFIKVPLLLMFSSYSSRVDVNKLCVCALTLLSNVIWPLPRDIEAVSQYNRPAVIRMWIFEQVIWLTLPASKRCKCQHAWMTTHHPPLDVSIQGMCCVFHCSCMLMLVLSDFCIQV